MTAEIDNQRDPAPGVDEGWMFPRIWSVCLVVLLAVTYRLWLPQSEMPLVPLLPGIQSLVTAPALSWILTSLLAASLLINIAAKKCLAWSWGLTVATLIGLIVCDQHRLQPWAYQSMIYAFVFSMVGYKHCRRFILMIAISVYVFSAAGKFDFQFTHTVGIDLLQTLLSPIGLDISKWDIETQAKLTLLMPLVELAAGLFLIPRRTRPVAGGVLIGMHLSLLFVLGPFGLGHSLGVLVWNVALLLQALMLFVIPGIMDPRDNRKLYHRLFGRHEHNRVRRVPWVATNFVVATALLMPLTERHGHWDHWLSWALYSPHNSRVDLEVHESVIQHLDAGLQQHAKSAENQSGWQQVSLHNWSLSARSVPLYPQSRYQLALVRAIMQNADLDRQVRCRSRGVADRWTGRRADKWLMGRQEIDKALKGFKLIP